MGARSWTQRTGGKLHMWVYVGRLTRKSEHMGDFFDGIKMRAGCRKMTVIGDNRDHLNYLCVDGCDEARVKRANPGSRCYQICTC